MSETERSCVYKFVVRSQESFEKGDTLPQVLARVDDYQKLVRRVYGPKSPFKRPAHRLATSKAGLSTIAVYEYSRHKGAPLPDSNVVIQHLMPIVDVRRAVCGGIKSPVDRQELIDF